MRPVVKASVFLLFFITVDATDAEQNRPKGAFTWTGVWKSMSLISLPRLEMKLQAPAAKSLARTTKQNVDTLHRIWNRHESGIDDDYLMDLTLEAHLLEKAALAKSEDEALEILEEVAADIETKLDHCVKHPRKMGSAVDLSVHIKGDDTDGWQVFHVLVGRRKFLGDPGEPLPRLSSPARGPVPVGRHLIWAVRGSVTTDAQPYKVGFGKDDNLIEIPAPPRGKSHHETRHVRR